MDRRMIPFKARPDLVSRDTAPIQHVPIDQVMADMAEEVAIWRYRLLFGNLGTHLADKINGKSAAEIKQIIDDEINRIIDDPQF